MIIEMTQSSSEISYLSYDDAFGKGFEDTSRRLPCMDRALEKLGWQPRVSLEDGLRETLDWCRTNFTTPTP